MKDRSIRDLAITFSILILITVRWIFVDAPWMGCVACVGILIAIFVLYDDMKRQFAYHKKFTRIRGLFIIVLFAVVTILILGIIGVLTFSSKMVDEFSLLTLLVSLPDKLYLSTVAKYLHTGKYEC